MHQGCVLSTFLFAVVVDVVTEFARESGISELLYADDLFLMSKTIEGHRNNILKWKEVFASMGLIVNLGKTQVMVCGGITKDVMSKSNVDPCGVCCLRVMANSYLCFQCNKWIHSRCAGMKSVTPKFSQKLACRKCEGNI